MGWQGTGRSYLEVTPAIVEVKAVLVVNVVSGFAGAATDEVEVQVVIAIGIKPRRSYILVSSI
ncbi:MAG: hypothetical protein CMO40_09400 [Verrucomicrobiaceae bacterium]|nr:hypothetical protein [Verrucomicrobiaceae bacterium]